jgi:NitT/TauT family transport system substrate-binding protein
MPHVHRTGAAGAAAALIGLTVLTAGCTSASALPDRAHGPEKPSIVVGAVPAIDTAGLYIAQQRGFFAAEGLRVKIVPIVSAETSISTQLAGGYDITLGNYVSYIQADAEQHAGLRIIAEASVMQPLNQEIMTLPSSRITTLAGLRGKRIGVNAPRNIGNVLIGSALLAQGLSLPQVKLVPVNFPDMTKALKDHQIDAAWLPEPFLSMAEEAIGAREILDLDEGTTAGFPIVGYAVTRAWEQRYPRTEAAFLTALEKGQELADTNRADVERAIESFLNVSGPTAAVMALPSYPLGVDRVRLQRVADAMLHFGLLKQPFSVGPMVG